MSLNERLNPQSSRGSQNMSENKGYEDLIRKLKILSKSQTAFLKKYLHDKLVEGTSLITEGLDILSRNGNGDAKIEHLKNSILALKLEELDVDVSSPELMLKDEIALLRSSVDAGVEKIVAATGGSSADGAKLRSLETENKRLRDLLRDAQAELGKGSNPLPPAPPDTGASSGRVVELEAQLKKKDTQLSTQQAEISRLIAASGSSDVTKALEDEIKRLKGQVAALEADNAKAVKDAEARLTARVKEQQEIADKRVAEVENRLEAEKDEMMDAMAQEVEDIEKTKNAERDVIVAEKKKVEERLVKASRTSKQLASGFGGLVSKARAVASDQKSLSSLAKSELNEMKQQLKMLLSGSLTSKIKELGDEVQVVNQRYRKEMQERKRLHNLVQELKGNIRVFLRCRPPSSRETEQYGSESNCISFPSPQEVKVFNEKNREKTWEFDEVFGFDATQASIYAEVSSLVVSVLDGYNVCIFAYGQTGSGKTFTMSGPADNRGVNTRALGELFTRTADRSAEYRDVITVSMLEVYNEDIHDLLVDGGSTEKLDVRQGEHGNWVPGLTSVPVESLQNVFDLLQVADRNRSQTATNMNEHSSRSHMMLTVNVVSENLVTGVVGRGKLNLVDLAGSERINKSGATGQALKEAQNINKSLSALGDVIAARASKQSHVPFRNSTLTYLLQDSLSQDSKTLMLVCVSPILQSAEETFCSLNFASRVRTVELGKASKHTGGSAAPPTGGGGAGAVPKPSGSGPTARRTSVGGPSPR